MKISPKIISALDYKVPHQNWPLLLLVILLTGCATSYRYATKEGCGVSQYEQKWAVENVASLSWSGECKSGLAEGKGILRAELKDQNIESFEGLMAAGMFVKGEYLTKYSETLVGEFQQGYFIRGKEFRSVSRLNSEGVYATIGLRNIPRLSEGIYYYLGGAERGTYVKGIFDTDPNNSIFIEGGKGVIQGEVFDSSGKLIFWIAKDQKYFDKAAYDRAITAFNDAEKRRGDEAQASQAKQDMKNKQDRNEMLSALTGMVTAAAQGKNADERRQLAIESLKDGASGGTTSISGGDYSEVVMEGLSPPGNARSRNACLRIEWLNAPINASTHGEDRLKDSKNFGDSAYSPLKQQKHLVVYNTCKEKLVVTVFACIEHRAARARHDHGYNWNIGEHWGTFFNDGFNGWGFMLVDDTRTLLTSNYVEDNEYTATATRTRRVYFGAWPHADTIDAQRGGFNSNSASFERKRDAVKRLMKRVLGKNENINESSYSSSWNSGSQLKEKVKDCSAFNARDIWNETQ